MNLEGLKSGYDKEKNKEIVKNKGINLEKLKEGYSEKTAPNISPSVKGSPLPGWLGSIMDEIQRGAYAVANTGNVIGREISPLGKRNEWSDTGQFSIGLDTDKLDFYKEQHDRLEEDVPEEFMAGINKEKRGSWVDVVENWQPRIYDEDDGWKYKAENFGRWLQGFAGDVVLDPVDWASAGIGTVSDVGKVARIADDVVGGLGDLSKYDDPVEEIIQAGIKADRWKEGSKVAERIREVGNKYGAETLKVADDLVDAGSKGQKPLLSVFGKPVVPNKVSEYAYKGIDKATSPINKNELLNKAFNTSSGIDELDDMTRQYEKAMNRAENIDVPKKASELKTKIDDIGDLTDDELAEISYKIEDTNLSPEDIEEMKTGELIGDLKSRQDEMLDLEKGIGIKLSDASTNDTEYFLHLLTPEARSRISKNKEKMKNFIDNLQGNLQHKSTIERNLKNMSIEEVNELARKGELPGYEGVKFNQFFETNPLVVQTARELRHAKAMETGKFLNDVVEKFADDAGRKLNIPTGKYAGILDGVKFPDDVASYIEDYIIKIEDLKTGNVDEIFKKFYDPYQSLWKKWQLLPIPGFHVRNFGDNFFKNYLGDVDANSYNDLFKALFDDSFEITTKGGKKISSEEFFDMALEEGIINKGFAGTQLDTDVIQRAIDGQDKLGADFKAAFREIIPNAETQGLPLTDFIVKLGGETGKANENFFRLAHFLDKIKKGQSADNAYKSVMKYLFDYSDLTSFERKVGKRIAPFYAFTRFNIPLQMKMLMQKPGKLTAINKFKQSIERYSEPESDITKWDLMETQPTVRMPWGDNPTYFNLAGWNSAMDLLDLSTPSSFAEMLSNSTAPALKGVIELGQGEKIFQDKPIEKYKGEPADVLGFDIPNTATIEEDNPLSFLGDIPITRPQYLKWLINYLPGNRVINELDNLNPNNIFYSEEERPNQQDESMRWLDFLTGLSTYESDPMTGAQIWENNFNSGMYQRLYDMMNNQSDADEINKLLQMYFMEQLNN